MHRDTEIHTERHTDPQIQTDRHIHTEAHRYTDTDTHTHTHTPHVYSKKVIGKPSIVRTSVELLSQPLTLLSVQYASSLQMLENSNA